MGPRELPGQCESGGLAPRALPLYWPLSLGAVPCAGAGPPLHCPFSSLPSCISAWTLGAEVRMVWGCGHGRDPSKHTCSGTPRSVGSWVGSTDLWPQCLQHPCRDPTTCQAAPGRGDPRWQEGVPQPPSGFSGRECLLCNHQPGRDPQPAAGNLCRGASWCRELGRGWESCQQYLGSTPLLRQGCQPPPRALGDVCTSVHTCIIQGRSRFSRGEQPQAREEPLASPWGGTWF